MFRCLFYGSRGRCCGRSCGCCHRDGCGSLGSTIDAVAVAVAVLGGSATVAVTVAVVGAVTGTDAVRGFWVRESKSNKY